MELLAPHRNERGRQLLASHLESLDPQAASARDRLELQLGRELTQRLVCALAPHRPGRRAA
jgi:hypothetical protein